MLKERVILPDYGAPDELPPIQADLARIGAHETGRGTGRRCPTRHRRAFGVRAERVQGGQENLVDGFVPGTDGIIAGQRRGHAVRDFTVVQQRASTRWPPDECNAVAARERRIYAAAGELVTAERQGGL